MNKFLSNMSEIFIMKKNKLQLMEVGQTRGRHSDQMSLTSSPILCISPSVFETSFVTMAVPWAFCSGKFSLKFVWDLPCFFKTHQNDPERTKSVFRGDFYLTGDRAYMDKDNYLYFVGRNDDVIISSG